MIAVSLAHDIPRRISSSTYFPPCNQACLSPYRLIVSPLTDNHRRIRPFHRFCVSSSRVSSIQTNRPSVILFENLSSDGEELEYQRRSFQRGSIRLIVTLEVAMAHDFSGAIRDQRKGGSRVSYRGNSYLLFLLFKI